MPLPVRVPHCSELPRQRTEKQLREIAHYLKNAGCEIAKNNDEWAMTLFSER